LILQTDIANRSGLVSAVPVKLWRASFLLRCPPVDEKDKCVKTGF
jgi:hypothetical protein